jgi:hypothetical protein
VTPTVNVDGSEKLSVETQNKLKEFQSRNGLPLSGELDPGTAQALSGMSRGDAIKSAQAVPPSRIQELTHVPAGHGS